jgi:2-keto-3-deoxy-L-rhamnonate aldolase RhmA
MTARWPLRLRLAAGERINGIMAFELFTPGLAAILAGSGFDFVILDTEHSGAGIDTIKRQIAYARGLGIEVWVRVPEKTYAAVATVLDAGAQGIMLPMVETANEASAFVEWARYRPEGKRGLAFGIGHDAYGAGDPIAAMRAANERTVLIALVESCRGIDNAEAILATPGIDIGWLGHFDLTADLGIPGQFDDPRFEMMLERFAAAGATSNKPLAIMHGEPTLLQRCAARGFRVFGAGSDVQAFRRGLSYSLAMLDEISPTEV